MNLTVQNHTAYCYTGGKPLNPAQPTALFIHGAQNDHSVWALQTRYFAHHGWNVLAVDLPGHGRSTGPALVSIEHMADWLLALLKAAQIKQVTLIGHSMGSLIALEAAFKAPNQVTQLVLLGATYPMKVSDTLLNTARDDEPRAIDMVNIWSHSSIAPKPSCPGPGFYVMGGSKRLMERMSTLNPEQLFYTDFSACNAYTHGEIAAQSVTCPTLFLIGMRDIMTPPKTTAVLINAIAKSKVVPVEQCGHALMSEQPDKVLDEMWSFVNQK